MGKTYREGHDFPEDFGFTGSAGKTQVRSHFRKMREPKPAPSQALEAPFPPPNPVKGRAK